jgi:hypothetical protein
MHRWLNHDVVGTSQRLLRRSAPSSRPAILLAALLGVQPACLNPDISDEDPLTMQAAALEVGDGGPPSDELVEDGARVEDEEPAEDDAVAPSTRRGPGDPARRRAW